MIVAYTKTMMRRRREGREGRAKKGKERRQGQRCLSEGRATPGSLPPLEEILHIGRQHKDRRIISPFLFVPSMAAPGALCTSHNS